MPVAQCLHRAFEVQVERTPHAVAVTSEGQELTYRELNARANQLARYLRSNRVGPETIVGLHLERSPELLVGMLGILKAGGAYLPLDPGYPPQRLAYMLSETDAPVLVTQGDRAAHLGLSTACTVRIDADWGRIATMSMENLEGGDRPDNLLYVIYTSGSTGAPKGVMVDHATVSRMFGAVWTRLSVDHTDVWTQVHSISFGFSVWEIWGALLTGGRIAIVPQATSVSPVELLDLVGHQRATILSQTPSAFRLLVQATQATRASRDLRLKYIIFSGEQLEPSLLRSWIALHGSERPQLINMYALTETGGEVAYRQLTEADVNGRRSVIGRPLPHARIYILDQSLRPVAQGETGELYIGGAAVARGYLKRPELTAERFIADPCTPAPGARCYRTGDRARRLPDGDLEFLGRLDRQLKVRGFRIEPAEIEAALLEDPGVSAAVVLTREDGQNDPRLVAYVVPAQPLPALTPQRLRQRLLASLPEYMVPSAFVVLQALPLGPNGKLDQAALPAPQRDQFVVSRVVEAPRTPVEESLVGIWKQVLNLDQVGVHDGFTALGGTSLLAVQLIVRVVRDFEVELSMRSLLAGSTVADLAEIIETVRGSADARRKFGVADQRSGSPTTDADTEVGEI
jgi:amino acid adenylation domain-containing protein